MREVSVWQLVSTGTTVRIMALNRSADPVLGQLFGPEIGPRIQQIDKHRASIRSWGSAS